MKGGFGCSPCCGPTCDECTRECTNPHTGTAFEVVYSYKFEGVEAGNPTDGYLEATGDADSSDPYDGMDGNGPWTQSVSANFNFLPSTTRFPCWVRVSFWRSQFLLGAATTPAPSQALDSQTITITNNGAGDIVIAGEFENAVVLAPGESHTDTGIPLVSGSGDQSTNRPRFYEGIASFRPACGNDSVNVTVTAEISWSVKKRQHILYGIVLECYEEGTPCATYCNGDPAADVLYLTISNYTGPTADLSDVSGTYVVERVAEFCDFYVGEWPHSCSGTSDNPLAGSLGPGVINLSANSLRMTHFSPSSNACRGWELNASPGVATLCGSGVLATGTNGSTQLNGDAIVANSFTWKIET